MTQTAKTGMAMHDLDPFAYDDVAENGEEREDSGEGGLTVNDEEGHIVDLEAIGEAPHTCSTGIGVRDDYDFVTTIDEFLSKVRRKVLRKGLRNGLDKGGILTVDSWYM